MADQPIVPPRDRKFRIKEYDAAHTGKLKEAEARERMVGLRKQVADLHSLLYANEGYALLVVLQGMDASGKDGAATSVFRDSGPAGLSVKAFGVPSEEERSHDYLWRIHRALPERGKTVIFNRSHYESVLVERVRGFAPKERWNERYEEINHFERMISEERTVVMKFFIHISRDEQREQLQQRIDDPAKRWKFRKGDLEDRALWDEYMDAYEDMVDRCNTAWAPWHVVPSNKRWYRDVVIAEALIARMEGLGLTYPVGEEGIEGLRIV